MQRCRILLGFVTIDFLQHSLVSYGPSFSNILVVKLIFQRWITLSIRSWKRSYFILSRTNEIKLRVLIPVRLFGGSWLLLASSGVRSGSKARCLVTSCISGPNGSRCSYVRGWLKLLPDSFIYRLAATRNGRPIAVPSTRINNVVRQDNGVNPNYTPRNLLWRV